MLRQLIPSPILRRLRHERGRWRLAVRTAENVAPLAPRRAIVLRLMLPPRLRLLCWPLHPSKWQAIYKICAVNGYEIVKDPDGPFDLALHFAHGGPCSLPEDARVLNRHCTDISKRHVAAVFESVFGYSLAVDPTRHCGPMVDKADANYCHDGRVIEGPIAPSAVAEDRVYQRLVDTADGREAIDLRTPLYGGRVPFVYIKRWALASRFANENTTVSLAEAGDIYSPQELHALRQFGTAMGLDYGELDVLRDRSDGRIYIVDVANTPAGPPNGLPTHLGRIAVRRLAKEFAALAVRRSPRHPLSPGRARSGPVGFSS